MQVIKFLIKWFFYIISAFFIYALTWALSLIILSVIFAPFFPHSDGKTVKSISQFVAFISALALPKHCYKYILTKFFPVKTKYKDDEL